MRNKHQFKITFNSSDSFIASTLLYVDFQLKLVKMCVINRKSLLDMDYMLKVKSLHIHNTYIALVKYNLL